MPKINIKFYEAQIIEKDKIERKEVKIAFDWDKTDISKKELLQVIARERKLNINEICFVSEYELYPEHKEAMMKASNLEKINMIDNIDNIENLNLPSLLALALVLRSIKLPHVCLNKKKYEEIYGKLPEEVTVQVARNSAGFFNHPIVSSVMTVANQIVDGFSRCCNNRAPK